MELFNQIIKRIKPEQEAFIEADETIRKINELLKANSINAECMAGGSYAKGTILKNDFDIDLFVRFDYSYKEKEKDISKLLAKALEPLKPTLIHGSRDYYQLRRKSLLFEIIPVLRIADYKQAVNVTDMSPLHVSYVKKHFEKNSGLADEIRLAKQFCKAIGVYGAESYIRGFSGHVLDLLLIYYGSFENLLMQASVWGSRAIIDIEKHLAEPLKQLNKSKTQSPLIIVDPVQPDRNAAASVSREKYELFKKKAREFLHAPSEGFFVIKRIDVKALKARAKDEWLVLLKIKPLEGNEDVVGTKVLKCFEHVEKQLRKHDFKLIEKGWEFDVDESIIYYIVKKEKLSTNKILTGPPVKVKKNAEMFRKKHKKVFERQGRLYAEEKRKYNTPDQLVKDLTKESYVKERVKAVSISK
ncbi:MAG TPA: CCA tRNA nucleotidyltransferase [Candidatus Nanoarchaeia archaeon]|nr:CCA tRNA nucleotidyltransferase [Candidatus Nanoarchaeia archaeon]